MESKQDPMAALIGGLLGGQEQSSTGDVGGVLQDLLGGQSGASGAQAQPSGDLGGLLGGMLGGQGAGGLAGLLGGSGYWTGWSTLLRRRWACHRKSPRRLSPSCCATCWAGRAAPPAVVDQAPAQQHVQAEAVVEQASAELQQAVGQATPQEAEAEPG